MASYGLNRTRVPKRAQCGGNRGCGERGGGLFSGFPLDCNKKALDGLTRDRRIVLDTEMHDVDSKPVMEVVVVA